MVGLLFKGFRTPSLRGSLSRASSSLHTRVNPRITTITSVAFTLSVRMSSSSSSYWTCNKCTFLNPPSQISTCEICLSPSPSLHSQSPSSSDSAPKWSCKACTFLNSYKNSNCEICDTRAPVSSLSSFDDLNDTTGPDADLGSSLGSVFWPLQPCNKKRKVPDPDSIEVAPDSDVDADAHLGGFRGVVKAPTVSENADSGMGSNTFKILSYNVWFREDVELHKRMKSLGDIIQEHSPDIICFQEVTPNIYSIFRQSSWWKVYRCSVSNEMSVSRPYFCMQLSKLPVKSFSCTPFGNSIMGRELCVAEIEVQREKSLIVATSHLESPCPAPPKWDQMYSRERVDQASEAINYLKKNQNVIFAGDMNWDDKLDGQFPLPEGWVDAWADLRPGENGWTYDTKSNLMLSGNRTLQKRLDRFVCSMHDFEISAIEMVGKDAIPGISFIKEKKVRKEVKKLDLPVLPSDHYGLLLTICSL